MALRLMNAIAGGRTLRSIGCALLLLGLQTLETEKSLAQDSEEAYSATVKVDATADSAAAAREAARIDGQRRALLAVMERLSGSTETVNPPKLDDKAITDMVASFEVANERMSAVRYIADYTFHFRPSKVRRLVRVSESPPAEGATKGTGESATKPVVERANRPVIVLPVYRDGQALVLWDDPNAWRLAWSQRSAEAGSARLVLPLGDAEDVVTIDAEKAESGKSDALSAIAQRNRGLDVVVATATARRQSDKLIGLELSIKRYRSGHVVDTQEILIEVNPGENEADLLRRAVESTASDIESTVKRSAGQRSDQPTSLAATVPINSLGEWVQLRNRLASVSVIRKIDLLSLSRQEAKIEVKYVGSQDQLKSSLAEVSLDLGGNDPLWRIQPSSATNAR
jgi:Uncharacterized protein conserved in bacteria (DUF2066)